MMKSESKSLTLDFATLIVSLPDLNGDLLNILAVLDMKLLVKSPNWEKMSPISKLEMLLVPVLKETSAKNVNTANKEIPICVLNGLVFMELTSEDMLLIFNYPPE